MTQLLAQSRMRAGFPFEPAGKAGRGTAIRCKDTQFVQTARAILTILSKTFIFVRIKRMIP